MLDDLLTRRLLVVLGKGGVGRTTVSAAIALVAARRGLRTLIIEADRHTPIARSYGQAPGLAAVELAPNLFAMALGGQESLEEYLSFVVPRPLLRAVFASSLYQYFVHAAPAVRELTMAGKVYHEVERRAAPQVPWHLVVFDAPASGQALSLLRMPFTANETFGASVVGREARAIATLLRDQKKCALLAVTTAEPLAVSETLEIRRALAPLELATAAIFFNRMSPAAFEVADLARLTRLAARSRELGPAARQLEDLEDLAALARDELKRRTRERRALAMLRRLTGGPLVTLEERRGLDGAALYAAAAAQLEAGVAPADGAAAPP